MKHGEAMAVSIRGEDSECVCLNIVLWGCRHLNGN